MYTRVDSVRLCINCVKREYETGNTRSVEKDLRSSVECFFYFPSLCDSETLMKEIKLRINRGVLNEILISDVSVTHRSRANLYSTYLYIYIFLKIIGFV